MTASRKTDDRENVLAEKREVGKPMASNFERRTQ